MTEKRKEKRIPEITSHHMMHGYAKASYTVEMTLLMSLILPLLIAILMAGFYLHDRALFQGAACEAAAMGSNLAVYDTQGSEVAALGHALTAHRAVWSRGASGSTSADQESASASFSGHFHWPGMIGKLWQSSHGQSEGQWSRRIYHSADLIRKVRGVEYVVDIVRSGSGKAADTKQ